MSATGRMLTKRNEYDAYGTPTWCTEAIVKQVTWGASPFILEPCKGKGAILDVLHMNALMLTDWCEIQEGKDFLTEDFQPSCRYDFVLTNPPFSLAQEFIERSLEIANCVIMLLRINFLASSRRKEFWKRNPPTAIHVLTKRPSFTGNGTDATDYAWFVWDSTRRQKQGFYWL